MTLCAQHRDPCRIDVGPQIPTLPWRGVSDGMQHSLDPHHCVACAEIEERGRGGRRRGSGHVGDAAAVRLCAASLDSVRVHAAHLTAHARARPRPRACTHLARADASGAVAHRPPQSGRRTPPRRCRPRAAATWRPRPRPRLRPRLCPRPRPRPRRAGAGAARSRASRGGAGSCSRRRRSGRPRGACVGRRQ